MNFDYIGQAKPKVALAFFLSLLGVLFSLVPYGCVAMILNGLLESESRVWPYVLILFLSYILSVSFKSASTVVSHDAAFSVLENVRLELIQKIERLAIGDVRTRSSGSWSLFITETIEKLEKPIAHLIPEVTANILASLLMIIFVFVFDYRLGIVNLLTIPLGLVFYMIMMRDYERQSKRHLQAASKMAATITEYVNGIQVIKAFNKSGASFAKYERAVTEERNANVDWFYATGKSMAITMELIPSTLLFVLPLGLYLLMHDWIAPGTFLTCVLLAMSTMRPLLEAMEYVATIADLKVTFEEIGKVMNLPEMHRPNDVKEVSSYTVTMEDVHFSYPNQKEEALKGIHMTCVEGGVTAIVGPSGGGKSTIASLLSGFYKANSGDIRIGDVSIDEMPFRQSMDLITYVAQDNFLFDTTILENIKMGNEQATKQDVQRVCEKIGIHDFIMSLPDGYDTNVGDAGNKLSGGQRQRITIARAIIKESPIVLLDEATSFVDPDNEANIQNAIDILAKEKTVIMIAHRLSTVVHASRIYVVNKGEIVDYGNHEELVEKCGLYRTMWRQRYV